MASSSPAASTSAPIQSNVTITKRCKEKLLGISILGLYLLGMKSTVMMPILMTTTSASSINNNDTDRMLLLCAATICAFLNLASHLLVIINEIRNVSVLSILVGVGLDVVSWMVYVGAFLSLFMAVDSSTDQLEAAISDRYFSLIAVGLLWLWNFAAHARALFFFQNLERLEDVVKSAHNNLVGDPGPYGMDHIFAYIGLGNHILVLCWCAERIRGGELVTTVVEFLTNPQRSTRIFGIAATLLTAVWMGRWTKFSRTASNKPKKEIVMSGHAPFLSLHQKKATSVEETSTTLELICDCPACHNQTSFTIFPSLCHLWWLCFEDLLKQVERIKEEREQKWQETLKAASETKGSAMDAASKVSVPEKESHAKKAANNFEPTGDNSSNANNDFTVNTNNTWRCACEGGFLPPGMLQSFGSAEAMMKMGTGQCYHKQ